MSGCTGCGWSWSLGFDVGSVTGAVPGTVESLVPLVCGSAACGDAVVADGGGRTDAAGLSFCALEEVVLPVADTDAEVVESVSTGWVPFDMWACAWCDV